MLLPPPGVGVREDILRESKCRALLGWTDFMPYFRTAAAVYHCRCCINGWRLCFCAELGITPQAVLLSMLCHESCATPLACTAASHRPSLRSQHTNCARAPKHRRSDRWVLCIRSSIQLLFANKTASDPRRSHPPVVLPVPPEQPAPYGMLMACMRDTALHWCHAPPAPQQ